MPNNLTDPEATAAAVTSAARHTPGPHEAILLSEESAMYAGKGWGVIATNPMRGRLDSQISGMTEGDARLFAAASDLLRAVRAALESSSSRTGGPCMCGACNLGRLAVAKVDGTNLSALSNAVKPEEKGSGQ